MTETKSFDTKRTFDTPLEKVWQAWTEAEEVAKWWGPNDTTSVKCVWEAKPGGVSHTVIKAGKLYGPAEGQEWESKGEFKEVEPRKKLVFTNSPYINGEMVAEHLITVTFEEVDGKTRVKMHNEVTKAKDSPEADGALQGIPYGWNQQLDKLAEIF